MFDNGEGRFVIDLQKKINIVKINLFIDQFRNHGYQIFTIWTSQNSLDVTGDPKSKGWIYTGFYGLQYDAPGSSGISYVFNNNLTCRYIMFLTDGNWHGSEYFKQIDIFEKNNGLE